MKTGAKTLALALFLLALAGCSGGGEEPSSSPSSPSSSPSDDDAGPDLAATDVCRLVREGIDAFNLGDLPGTIAKFESARGPAGDLAREQPSARTATLRDAVEYYAELPADEYIEASQASPEFLRFKDFTLTECAYTGPPNQSGDDGRVTA